MRRRDAGLQAGEHAKEALRVLRDLFRSQRERNPDVFGSASEVERGRHDADDLVRRSIELESPAEDLWVAIEAGHPQSMADDDDVRIAGHVFLGAERSAQLRLRAEHREVLRRHPPAADDLRKIAKHHGHAGLEDPRRHRGERRDAAHREKLRSGRRRRLAAARRLYLDNSIRILEWQGAKNDGVERPEHRGRGADAEAEGDDRDRGESARLRQLSNRESDVLTQLFAKFGAVGAAIALLAKTAARRASRFDIAEAPFSFRVRLLTRHALLHELTNGHLDVERELVVDFPVDGAAPEAAFHAGSNSGATAATKPANSFVSLRSSRRPASVMLYIFALRPSSEIPQSDSIQPSRSIRYSAG